MVWETFSKELQEAIKERGFDKPTSVQTEGIPFIVRGEDTLLIAPTGVGKTESALFPVFDEFVRDRKKSELKPISILYITPLKSLNRDLLKRIMWWSEKLDFEVSVRHGDTSQYERSMQAENPADMFITTPETLQAMLVGSRMREHLKNIRWIVIDEIHELVGNKRGVQLSVGLERLKSLIAQQHPGRKPQIVGLSATVGSPERVADFLTAGKPCKIVNAAEKKRIKITVESPVSVSKDNEIAQTLFVGEETASRLRRIEELIRNSGSTLTFTNTREFAEVLSSRLKAMSTMLPIETHHSSLSKDVRIDAEERFKREEIKGLICTSSLELGIDIGSINLVIQYMSPRQVAKALQRVGRSGHDIRKESNGIIISTDSDDCFEASVIAKLGMERKIEKTRIYTKSLDILGHQIVGLALEEYMIPVTKAYEIIRRSSTFRELTMEEFRSVCLLMQKLGFIWVDTKYTEEPVVKRRKNSWVYYYQNLSSIPDTKNYKIIDIVSNKSVGTLDAEFIAMHGSPGTTFIVKGQGWKIIDVTENKILVEPMNDMRAAIPAWEGELIPVPYDVAQGVGVLRRKISEMLDAGTEKKKIVESLKSEYPIEAEVAIKMIKTMEKQSKFRPIPDENTLVAESWEDFVVLHAPFGSMVNETIGRVLATLLTNKIGSVGLQTDPYRIIIRLPGHQYDEVVNAFSNMDPETIQGILEITLPNEELFTWRFIQIAQRFGIIARDAEYGKGYMRKIIEVYFRQPPYLEALNEIFQEKLDVETAKSVLRKIKEGKIKIKRISGLSPIGESGISRKYEIVAPDKPDKEIFALFKKRLMDTKMGLVCANCGEVFSTSTIVNVPEKVQCRACKAKLIGYVPYQYVRDGSKLVKKHLKGGELAGQEDRYIEAINDSASLILNSGRDAILVLAGRGVGARTAARILKKGSKGDDLLRDILEAEKQFARTSKFWK
jgi:ATP-dependent Lhr-like helicase